MSKTHEFFVQSAFCLYCSTGVLMFQGRCWKDWQKKIDPHGSPGHFNSFCLCSKSGVFQAHVWNQAIAIALVMSRQCRSEALLP